MIIRSRERDQISEMSCGFIPASGGCGGGLRLPTGGGGGTRRSGGVSSISCRPRAAAAAEGGGGVSVGAKRGSFYEVLGIPVGGGADEIKQAYKRMAKMYHPDACPLGRPDDCTRRFIQLHEAYETLSDPRRRALYDQDLALGFHARRRQDQGLEERTTWRSQWQDQISGLNRRSMNKDSEKNLSWGARMRRQMAESESSREY